jgi:hypothetical protein
MSCQMPSFQPAYMRISWLKLVQSQREHTIGRVVAIGGICHFIDPKTLWTPSSSPAHNPTILPTIRISEKLIGKSKNK